AMEFANRKRLHRRCDGSVAGARQRSFEEPNIHALIVNDQDAGVEDIRWPDHYRFSARSSAASSASMNSVTLMGFVRYRRNPAFRPFSMSRGMALALRATTGVCAVAVSLRRIFSASNPEISGRLISIRIIS